MITPTVPRASASVAALVMLAGLALVYWSLTELGVWVAKGSASGDDPVTSGRVRGGSWGDSTEGTT